MGRTEQRKYRAQSIRYLENAWRLLGQGELDKASELLWGSMAEAVKAIAAGKDVVLRSHRQVLHYGQGLAKLQEDGALRHALHTANSLHFNYYEVDLGPREVWPLAEEVRAAVAKLLAELPDN